MQPLENPPDEAGTEILGPLADPDAVLQILWCLAHQNGGEVRLRRLSVEEWRMGARLTVFNDPLGRELIIRAEPPLEEGLSIQQDLNAGR